MWLILDIMGLTPQPWQNMLTKLNIVFVLKILVSLQGLTTSIIESLGRLSKLKKYLAC